MKRIGSLLMVTLSGISVVGCADLFRTSGYGTIDGFPQPTVDRSLQALCDVDRARSRNDLLKRVQVEKLREVALRVSDEISREEISDLIRLEHARRTSPDPTWEIGRRRGELISEIYTGALIRAGFRPGTSEPITGTDLTYSVGVNAQVAGNGPYADFITGNLTKVRPDEGAIAQLSLGASPDQKRYYVTLYRFTRFETQPDGSQRPIYAGMSLLDAAEETVPRHCFTVESALDTDQFNTIAGLGALDAGTVRPIPAPIPAPAPEPAPAPAPLPNPTP